MDRLEVGKLICIANPRASLNPACIRDQILAVLYREALHENCRGT